MKKFRTALFNGYQKNAVDEYLEDLMQELEVLRQDAFKAQSAGQLRTQLEEIRQENERLQESLQEKSRKLEEEAEQKQLLISEHEKNALLPFPLVPFSYAPSAKRGMARTAQPG